MYTLSGRFEWDEQKNEENIRKHGLDFEDAPEVFNFPMLVRLDDRTDYGEDRWIGVGMIRGRVVVVVYTERDGGDTIRVISLRKALKHERQGYEKILSHGLESH